MKKIWLLIITLTILTACKTAETPKSAEIVQPEKPLTIGDDKQFLSESLPSEIKVRVTISRSEDLRVSVGQKIKTGDRLADRKRERDTLLMQKQQATLALERMKTWKNQFCPMPRSPNTKPQSIAPPLRLKP